MRIRPLLPILVLLVLLGPALAAADPPEGPLRPSGTLVLGITIPDEIFINAGYSPIPLPGLRLAYHVTSHVSLDVGAGALVSPNYVAGVGHVGVRWLPWDQRLAPYAFARIGEWSGAGEGKTGIRWGAVGGGIEYVLRQGRLLWIELGAGPAISDAHSDLALYGSAGYGFRFAGSQHARSAVATAR